MTAQAGETVLVEALQNYGPLGLILLALAMEWLFTRSHVKDLRRQITELQADLKEAREDIRRGNTVAQEIIVPLATKTLEAVNTFNEELNWRRRSAS